MSGKESLGSRNLIGTNSFAMDAEEILSIKF